MDHKKEKLQQQTTDEYDYLANAASSQDCTGLIPANPFPELMEDYQDIYHYEPPKPKMKEL